MHRTRREVRSDPFRCRAFDNDAEWPPTEAAFYRLKRAKYLVCNIYDATLKIIAVAKVKANIVIHICSSIAWQAGARTVSQPPAPGLSSSRWTGRSR
jgi:hypothetical protein